jgi:hypothetical protein
LGKTLKIEKKDSMALSSVGEEFRPPWLHFPRRVMRCLFFHIFGHLGCLAVTGQRVSAISKQPPFYFILIIIYNIVHPLSPSKCKSLYHPVSHQQQRYYILQDNKDDRVDSQQQLPKIIIIATGYFSGTEIRPPRD